MKQSFRMLSALVLTAVYCYAMVAGSRSALPSGTLGRPSSDTERHISAISDKLLCHVPPAETSVNQNHNPPVANFKLPFPGSATLVRTGDRLFQTGFSQYSDLSEGLLIHHRKSDIIFPFHYFW